MDGIGCVVFTDYIFYSSMTYLPACLSVCLDCEKKEKKEKKRKKRREMRVSEVS